MNKKVKFRDLGLIEYKKAWEYQEKLFTEILEIKSLNRRENKKIPTKNHLLFCEHSNVFTLGKSGKKKNLLVNEEYLKTKGARFYEINRGGDITYHGPGQIVGYPIIDLDNFFTDIHKYLRLLEESIIMTLKSYGLESGRSKGETGVWIDALTKNPRKICALGVKSSRWVCMHGFAFNINTDLTYFEDIIPCGIIDKGVTSLQKELGKKINMEEVKQILKKNIFKLFEMEDY